VPNKELHSISSKSIWTVRPAPPITSLSHTQAESRRGFRYQCGPVGIIELCHDVDCFSTPERLEPDGSCACYGRGRYRPEQPSIHADRDEARDRRPSGGNGSLAEQVIAAALAYRARSPVILGMTGASLGGLTQAAAPTQAGVNQVDVEENPGFREFRGHCQLLKGNCISQARRGETIVCFWRRFVRT
jgi:hypothetical protein